MNPNLGSAVERPRLEILLLAMASLVLELAITRVAAFVLQYHYSFFAVALGIGGLGLGMALAMRRPRLGRSHRGAAAASAAVLAVGLLALPTVTGALPLAASATILGLASLITFVVLGLALGLAFEAARAQVRSSYSMDAAGAAVGTLLAIGLLEVGGPGAAVAVASASALTAGWLALPQAGWRLAFALGAPALAAGAVFSVPGVSAAPQESPLGRRLRGGGTALNVRWNAYGRTDLVASRPEWGFQEIYTDGTAPAMIVLNGQDPAVQDAHRRELSFVPFRLRRPRSVLSLGGGAGYDAWLARLVGAERIDVVEINQAALDFAASRPGTSADILRARGVQVFQDDGRRFLERSPDREYDLIVLALYQGQADARANVGLRESSAYTIEAINAYIDHLTPRGRVAVLLHSDVLLERLRRTVEEVLGDPRGRILTLHHAGSAPYEYLLYFGAVPFLASERSVAARLSRTRGIGAASRVAAGSRDLSPVSDERPFFFHTDGYAPPTLWGIALALGLLALFLCLIRGSSRLSPGVRFAALLSGAGFASVEVLLVQRILPLLGSSVLTLGTVSAAMLVGAALGAVQGRRSYRAATVAAVCLVIVTVLAGLLGPELQELTAFPPWVSVLVAVVGGVLSGFFAGHQLPLVLEEAGERPGGVSRLWAISSLGAITGSCVLLLVAMDSGYSVAAAIPITAYATLPFFLPRP